MDVLRRRAGRSDGRGHGARAVRGASSSVRRSQGEPGRTSARCRRARMGRPRTPRTRTASSPSRSCLTSRGSAAPSVGSVAGTGRRAGLRRLVRSSQYAHRHKPAPDAPRTRGQPGPRHLLAGVVSQACGICSPAWSARGTARRRGQPGRGICSPAWSARPAARACAWEARTEQVTAHRATWILCATQISTPMALPGTSCGPPFAQDAWNRRLRPKCTGAGLPRRRVHARSADLDAQKARFPSTRCVRRRSGPWVRPEDVRHVASMHLAQPWALRASARLSQGLSTSLAGPQRRPHIVAMDRGARRGP